MTTNTQQYLVLSVYCTDVEQTSLNLCMLYIIFICIKNIQSNSFFSNYFHRIQNQTQQWLSIRRTRTNRNTKRSSQTDVRHASTGTLVLAPELRRNSSLSLTVLKHILKTLHMHLIACIQTVWWRRKRPIHRLSLKCEFG